MVNRRIPILSIIFTVVMAVVSCTYKGDVSQSIDGPSVAEDPFEQLVAEELPEETIKNLTEEERKKEWVRYIDQVKQVMPMTFTGTEQLDYKGDIYAIVINSNEIPGSEINHYKEIERVLGSLDKLGVENKNITLLYNTLDEAAEELGAINLTRNSLERVFGEYNKRFTDEDVLIVYITGRDKIKFRKGGIAVADGRVDREKIKQHYIDVIYLPEEMKAKVKGKKLLFLGHFCCGMLGDDLRNIYNLVSVNAAERGKEHTITSDYSINSTVVEAIARSATVEQAHRYALEEQKKILEYGHRLGLVEHTDEGSCISRVEFNPITRKFIKELPDLMTNHIKKD